MTSGFAPPPPPPVAPNAKAPVKAMWICLLLGLIFFVLPFPGTILAAAPLNLAAFILAIVCLTRGRTAHGVIGLVGTTVVAALAYLLGLTLLAISAAGISAEDAHREQDAAARTVRTAQNPIPVDAETLLRDYAGNEQAADSLYKGKVLRITGTVSGVDKDFLDLPFITFASADVSTVRQIQCTFPIDPGTGRIRPGSVVTVRGRCDGLFINVQINGSQIEE